MPTLYHNPRCSKSRQGLELCNSSETEVIVVNYLKQKLTENELTGIISRFGGCPSKLIRNSDDAFKKSQYFELDLINPVNVLAILHNLPQVMQRPLLDDGNNVIIGRPPENFKNLLG
ncbi:MAG: ArsC/Spx/MgsR family protein [Candidatus Poseidoniaceae archaeon]|jgi:arsenate reductase